MPDWPPPVPRSLPPRPSRRPTSRCPRSRRPRSRCPRTRPEPPPDEPPREPASPSCSAARQRARVLRRLDLLVLVQVGDLERHSTLPLSTPACRCCRSLGTSNPNSTSIWRRILSSLPVHTSKLRVLDRLLDLLLLALRSACSGVCWFCTPRLDARPQQVVEVVHERRHVDVRGDVDASCAPPTSSVPSFFGSLIQSRGLMPSCANVKLLLSVLVALARRARTCA